MYQYSQHNMHSTTALTQRPRVQIQSEPRNPSSGFISKFLNWTTTAMVTSALHSYTSSSHHSFYAVNTTPKLVQEERKTYTARTQNEFNTNAKCVRTSTLYGVSACVQHQQRNASVIIIRVNSQTNLTQTFSKLKSAVSNMSNLPMEFRCSCLNTLLEVSAEYSSLPPFPRSFLRVSPWVISLFPHIRSRVFSPCDKCIPPHTLEWKKVSCQILHYVVDDKSCQLDYNDCTTSLHGCWGEWQPIFLSSSKKYRRTLLMNINPVTWNGPQKSRRINRVDVLKEVFK